jgi:hypothetical protein
MPELRSWAIAFAFALGIGVGILAVSAARADLAPEFPEPKACAPQPDDPTILPAEKSDWTDCERWAWSCIRKGEEANFFTKECLKPRTTAQSEARKRLRLAPFFQPERYESTNALSDRFLMSLLDNPEYNKHIPAVGIRIFGAYFKNPVNLENVSTTLNVVIDGSMMRLGLRMTNFSTTKNLSVDGSNIRGSFYLMRARIDGSLFMERGVFDTVDLRDARIGSSVEGTGSVFTSDFQFDRATVDGKLILTKSRLTLLKGWDARIGGSMELRLADVRRKVDLTGVRIQGDLRMQDVTFGRQALPGDTHCDWDPTLKASYVLNEIQATLAPEDAALAMGEVVEGRPSYAGKASDNPCRDKSGAKLPLLRNEVLLRDMKIGGTLCIVDTTGDIAGGSPDKPKAIETISLDGTEAKSTVLGWKKSDSPTLWRAVNYKTGYMVINLNEQPKNHYIDNLDTGFITFVRRDPREFAPDDLAGQSDEHLVKYKCELTPASDTVDLAEDKGTQERISRFFTSDRSGSAQPFANVVARLEASSVNTLNLRKDLSDFRYRNACSYSEYSRVRREAPWLSVREALSTAMTKAPRDTVHATFVATEASLIGLDFACSAGLAGLRQMVYYGHEPWRIVYYIAGAIILFWLLLKLDPQTPGSVMMRRRFGVSYAFDNLIPLKAYRMVPDAADQLPIRPSLRFYRAFHRALGLLFAVMIFFFVYKAST